MNIESDEKKILIVDDAGYIRVLFREALKNEGYTVLTESGVMAAYETIKKECPDLLLLDVNLEDGSGIELLKQLRSENNSIPVIMITSESLKETVISAAKCNIKSFLTKPVDINVLKMRIREVFENNG
ncbi:MAG: response regulator [Candidatus Wallbacteria bacterium]|nr:response regulator [Candidatus Wallbacteria bacterium]